MKRFLLAALIFSSCVGKQASKISRRVAYIDSVLNHVQHMVLIKETYDLSDEWGTSKREYLYKLPDDLQLINDIRKYKLPDDLQLKDVSRADTVDYYHSAFFINNKLAMVQGSSYVGKKCYWNTCYYVDGNTIIYKRHTGREEDLDTFVIGYIKAGLVFVPKSKK